MSSIAKPPVRPVATSGPTGSLALFEGCLGLAAALVVALRSAHDSTSSRGSVLVGAAWVVISAAAAIGGLVSMVARPPAVLRWAVRILGHLAIWPVIWIFAILALPALLPWNRGTVRPG